MAPDDTLAAIDNKVFDSPSTHEGQSRQQKADGFALVSQIHIQLGDRQAAMWFMSCAMWRMTPYELGRAIGFERGDTHIMLRHGHIRNLELQAKLNQMTAAEDRMMDNFDADEAGPWLETHRAGPDGITMQEAVLAGRFDIILLELDRRSAGGR